MSYFRRKSSQQAAAVKLIERKGLLSYSEVVPVRNQLARLLLGDERHGNTTTASLAISDVGDSDLGLIGHLENLRILDLSQTQVTDAGLYHLRKLSKLKCVYLDETDVGDEGLEHLPSEELEELSLRYTRISNCGVDTVSRMDKVKCLRLDGTTIDDGACLALNKMENLEELSLSQTSISDVGIASLSLPRLKRLSLYRTKVTPNRVRLFRAHFPDINVGADFTD